MKKALGFVFEAGKRMPWKKGVIVGNFVFLTGCEGRDPETGIEAKGIKAQTFLALDKVKQRLEEAGTSIENVVKFTWYLKDRSLVKEFREAREEWFRKNCPQLLENPDYATTLVIAGLSKEEMLIEVDVIAYLPDKQNAR